MRRRGGIVPLEGDSVKIYKGLRAFSKALQREKGFVSFYKFNRIKVRSRFLVLISGKRRYPIRRIQSICIMSL